MNRSFTVDCPISGCKKTEIHSHEVCDACGAADYGNILCCKCRSHLLVRARENGFENLEDVILAINYASIGGNIGKTGIMETGRRDTIH